MTDHGIITTAHSVRQLQSDRKTNSRRLSKRWLKVKAGDRLYVKETWAQIHPCAILPERFSIPGTAGIPGPPRVGYRVVYRADGEFQRAWHCDEFPWRTVNGPRDEIAAKHPDVCSDGLCWTSSMFMPKAYSRITLIATEDAREERLQDISEADAIAEGCEELGLCGFVGGFIDIWDSLHAKDAPWSSNPTVVRLAFRLEGKL